MCVYSLAFSYEINIIFLELLYDLIQGTPINIIVGSHVWAEDSEAAWIDAQVKKIHGRDATIITTNGKTVSYYDLNSHIKYYWFLQ